MKRILYILFAIGMVACNTKKQEPAQNYTATPNGLADLQKPAVTSTGAVPVNQSNLLLNPKHGEPGHDCSIAVGAPLKAGTKANTAPAVTTPTVTQVVSPQPTAAVTSTPQSTAGTVDSKGQKLNPAHGQPNHRCDIAVGAPLNSKPAQASVKPQVTVSQPTATATPQAPVLNEKGQKLNPAHGQPGHKCAVAVGAPLT
ncbi:hypothetical protein FA048_05275 [Pedobacter polaris]|uniref:Uncharacterized protein n=1 Tax=Pedobacter polaris TaxID=2571273 RepID=A0A4U1CXC6_9SPHI|nr:hypothetical protein [Pedobacter polaris]TKC13030.1 hypothetical protein FA048_05275 [Pedobacter polaris]